MSTESVPQRRAGRPMRSDAQVERTRRAIIDAAKSLFEEDGIENVSMRNIAERAGCSPRLPYLYFDNKLRIIRYIWEDVFIALFALCEDAVAGKIGSETRLRAFMTTYAGFWHNNPDRFELVFMVKDQIGGPDDAYYVEASGVTGRYQILQTLIEDCVDDGRLTEADAELSAQLLLSSIHGILGLTISVPEYPWRDFETLLEGAVNAFFRAR